MNKKKHIIGGILWILVISGVGYLLCSLFSLSFNMDEWNTFSNIIKWIIAAIDGLLIVDIIQIPFDDTNEYL